MLLLLATVVAQPLPQPAVQRSADCKPSLMRMSAKREIADRQAPDPRRPRPCITLASVRG